MGKGRGGQGGWVEGRGGEEAKHACLLDDTREMLEMRGNSKLLTALAGRSRPVPWPLRRDGAQLQEQTERAIHCLEISVVT